MAIKNHHCGNHRCTLPRAQTGAVLLAFILVFIVASTFYLTTKLNTNLAKTQHSVETGIAMKAARNALIGYAISYPDKINANEGPGYLPCPDINNDGSAGSGCSLTGTTSIGRFPYKTLETEELRDGHGERLWYVVSDNFRNNPKMIPLNSETAGNSSGDMTVDGYTNIAAVIFSADALVNNQNRISANENDYIHYLEATFTDSDGDAVIDTITTVDTDRYILLTKDELMQAVEKRVLGEVSMMLTNYFDFIDTDSDGDAAYPWLTPFADPKASKPALSGEHDGGDDVANLSDSSRDFNVWGVAIGDVARNLTDGSVGTVTAVAATTLTIGGGGMSLGTENLFDNDDEYYIYPAALSDTGQLTGTATNTNNNASLEDTNNDFVELEITVGDIVDNLTDGSSGVVESVSATELTFITLPNTLTLSGGTENDFDTNDVYRIRSQHGKATADTDANGLTLEDTTNDFVVMGIQAGDIIVNHTDGSVGRATAVAANTLTVDELYFGSDNSFKIDDYYSIPQYNTDNATREGLLSFHGVGEYFSTGFSLDWDVTVLNAGDIVFDIATFANVEAAYQMAGLYLQNYAIAGSLAITDSNGFCIWSVPDIADCYGWVTQNINISGTVTAGENTNVIIDANADFITDLVKRGDIVQAYDDKFLTGVTGIIDAGTNGTATGGSSGLLLEDTNNNYTNLGIVMGDTITNITDGSTGTIASVLANEITASALSGGTDNDFDPGDTYQVQSAAKLYDAATNFNFNNIEPYQYMIFNDTTGIRGVITEINNDNSLTAVEFDNQSSAITFSPGDSFTIYTPGIDVVDTRDSATQVTTTRTGVYNPDFDSNAGVYEEYYRIVPAANFYDGGGVATVTGVILTGAPDGFSDAAADFITEGIAVGDIIENVTDGSFGEIIARDATRIQTELTGGILSDFTVGDSYVIYHDYVYSRKHEFHTKFSGNQTTKTLTEERARDVCIGYNADCSAIAAAVNFSGNGGAPLITIRDYEGDEITEAGRASFTPSNLSTGSVMVSNIDFNLHSADVDLNGDGDYLDAGDIEPDIPGWFIANKWHQLIYVAYSAGDSPNGGATCTAGTDCLTLTGGGSPDNNKRALVISVGEPLATQDRTSGSISDYYENENNDAGDDNFQIGEITGTFNDQIRVLDTSP